ncbi:hypothetical protein H8E88_32250 [candidate division KSB1 bacterium]|nr:hypothetical protein [candidate division KSB1 bacterium]
MDMIEFAKYIKDKPFDEELHHVREKSLDRIIDSEHTWQKQIKPKRKSAC